MRKETKAATAKHADGCLADLGALSRAPRKQLVASWRELYGRKPPGRMQKPLLILAIAYRLQEKNHGGLKATLQRQLVQAAGPGAAPTPKSRPKLRTGTVLVREWQGVSYTVNVLDKGVALKGKVYRSLTEVAEVITGTHWSGPTFFGLNGKRRVIRE